MDKHVGRCEPLRHLLREAFHADARLVPNRSRRRSAEVLVAAAEADDTDDLGDRECLHDGAVDVAHAPAATGHENHLSCVGQPERPPCVEDRARFEERGSVNPWTHGTAASGPTMPRTSAIDSGCVTRCVSTPALAQ